jgi:6-phosphogluconolactonase
MHGMIRAAGALGILTAALTGSVAGARADDGSFGNGHFVVGHVYVDDNTAGANTVAGFDRHADGTLTPIAGSPFAIGGAGTGAGIGSQDALQVAGDGRFLLAVDAGSNQISVLRIRHDGSLTPVSGGPVASNGVEPLSIAVHDRLVYVANAGAGGSNYTGFVLGFNGNLSPLAGSTVPVPDGSGLGDVLFNGFGNRLIGVRVSPSQIDSFTVGFDGRLTAAPGSPFTAQSLGPFGSEFRPTNPYQLFVSNAHAGAGNGTVSAFNDFTGVLTSIGTSPFADHQTAPCWLTISPNGQYLYATNTADSTISSFSIANDGTLTLLGSTAVSNGAGAKPVETRLDPTGRFLYIVESGHDAIGAFAVNGGTLTELASSPFALPAGATPFGMAVTGPWFFGDDN